MSRRYGRIKEREIEITAMREAGKTRREIGEALGLTKEQIKGWAKQYNKCIEETGSGLPKQGGWKTAVTLAEYKYENKRLQMENELLRNFLHLAGRSEGKREIFGDFSSKGKVPNQEDVRVFRGVSQRVLRFR